MHDAAGDVWEAGFFFCGLGFGFGGRVMLSDMLHRLLVGQDDCTHA